MIAEATDIMAFSGVITATIGVIKTFELFNEKWNPLVAIGLAAIFVLSPSWLQNIITSILVLGLTASGHYHYSKKRGGQK